MTSLPVRKNRFVTSEKDHKVAIISMFMEPKEATVKEAKKECCINKYRILIDRNYLS